MYNLRRSQLWLANLGAINGKDDHIKRGVRPVIIISNNMANANSPVIHVVPITTKVRRRLYLPTHVFLNGFHTQGLYNPNLLIMNRHAPAVSQWDFPSEESIKRYRNSAIEKNTHFISELCDEFNIREKDVPSIILFPTEPFNKSTPAIIPIKSDNLYISIKSLTAAVESELANWGKFNNKVQNIISSLEKISHEIEQNTISGAERRYINAKAKLLQELEKDSTEINKLLLREAIEKRDIHACKLFPQPYRRYLNQIIDLQKEYKEIERSVSDKYSSEQKLCAKKAALEKARSESLNMLKEAHFKLDLALKRYIAEQQTKSNNGEKRMNIRVPHFKIGITFSGKYRETYVEPFAYELLNMGFTREDIFYDSWHDALINGVHGDSILRQIYFKNCDCVVVFLSPDYKEKNWTDHIEWSAIKELINTGNDDKICLLSVDSANIGEIDGLYQHQAIVKTINDMSAHDIADFVVKKYKMLV